MTSMYRLCTWHGKRVSVDTPVMYKAILLVDPRDLQAPGELQALAVWDLSYRDGRLSKNYEFYYSKDKLQEL